jgi:hypothetical protein
MTRVLLVLIICLSLRPGRGAASQSSPYQYFADMRSEACTGWSASSLREDGGYDRTRWLIHGAQHAWVYGFIAGAGYMPPVTDRSGERFTPVDVRNVDAWMSQYCQAHPTATVGEAVRGLVAELAELRSRGSR